jgi:carbon-monoxide dehydrogenase iron sulfur subunit
MKVIGVHLDRCTGCRTCELYCATERGSTGRTLLKAVQESPLPQARLRLKAPCMEACLNAALVRDPKTDLVVVKEDRCIACWTCTIFCPFGVIFPWPERKMALKCDRCGYMDNPVCVEVCPSRALELVELADYEKYFHQKRGEVTSSLSGGKKDGPMMLLDLQES